MKRSERTLVTIFLLFSMAFLSSIFAVQGSLLTSMIEGFQLDAGKQGLANTVAFAGGIIALVGSFALQGRQKKRTLLKIAVAICAAGLAGLWLAPSFPLYLAAWFVVGFGLGLMDTLLSACMADLYTGKTAVMMMCLLHTSNGLASVLAPIGYAALLNVGLSWKAVYLVIALAGLAILAAALLIRHVCRISDNESLVPQNISPARILPALHKGRLLWLTVSIFFHGIFLSGLNTWVNRYTEILADGVAFPAQSCVFLGLMLSRLLMPFLPIKAERYVVTGGFLGCIALAVGLLFPGGWPLRILLMLSSLMFGALLPCVVTLGCERHRSNTLLATTGVMLALYLGQGAASPLIAWLEGLFSLRAGMYLCAVCMALCSLCCLIDALSVTKTANCKSTENLSD